MQTGATSPTIPSFADYVSDRRYLRNVSPKTLSWFHDAWKAFGPHLEPILLNGGSVPDGVRAGIATLLAKGVKPVSINSYLTCVRAFLNWLYSEGHLAAKPRVQLLKYERKVISTFTPQQIQAMLTFKPYGLNATRTWTAACLILDTGLRLSETLTLRKGDVDFDNLVLKVKGKGGKQRLVPISIQARKLLYRYASKQPHDLIFGTRTGSRVSNRNFLRDFKQMCSRLSLSGVRCSPHTLRHTFAASYLRNGGNLFYLSRILGHTNIKTTERYLQSIDVGDLQAVHDRFSLLTR